LDREILLTNSKEVVPVSVTGNWCALNCAHCGRHYLHHMSPIAQLESWYQIGRRHFLISGGMDEFGRIPVNGVIDMIERFKKAHPDVHFNFHTGLVDQAIAQKIAAIADSVSFDFVGSAETIREVYGLEKTPEDFLKSARFLSEFNQNFAIHVTIGLKRGVLSHEEQALELLQDLAFEKLIFIVFIPTLRTRYESANPPDLEDVKRVFDLARERFPHKHIALGCMQPRGNYRDRLQEIALSCGLNEIVNPTRKLKELLRKRDIPYKERIGCCAM